QYANPKSTLITHPTRLKILEALQSGRKTVKDLEGYTKEDRINLYYHLTLLEAEELVVANVAGREKSFQLLKPQSDVTPVSFRLVVPSDLAKRQHFIEKLQQLRLASAGSIPELSTEFLKISDTKTLYLDLFFQASTENYADQVKIENH
ncbi:MAG TPA: winged helix-turn-helix domain-containing protein, partial [Candidatus Hodarchaeales archaeon]|nr:winged helix-turn-helix domain-containing protein [Candidatus Hodarchaeales archaeon]